MSKLGRPNLQKVPKTLLRGARLGRPNMQKSARNLAPQDSFVSFFKVIFRSGLIFSIGSGLGVSTVLESLFCNSCFCHRIRTYC